MLPFPSLAALMDVQKPESLLVDLWGVIHDGDALYPNVRDALAMLKTRGIRVIFLSNAPRRAEMAKVNLDRLGITPDFYTGIVTSGEAFFHSLKPEQKNYIYIGPEKDRTLLNGLPYMQVSSASNAAFAVCTGFDNDASTLDEKLPELKAALAARIPLICANPDMEIVRINGTRALCAGVMAEWYQQQGGTVHYYGKPYKNIYDLALTTYNLQPTTTLAIGDNLNTDIKGANDYGISSVLVTGGVLKEELEHGKTINEICRANGNIPQFLIAAFA
jgi:HAD superfamily hydrolase (TIGR01459 family)